MEVKAFTTKARVDTTRATTKEAMAHPASVRTPTQATAPTWATAAARLAATINQTTTTIEATTQATTIAQTIKINRRNLKAQLQRKRLRLQRNSS